MSRNPFRQARDNNEEVRALQDGSVAAIFDSKAIRADPSETERPQTPVGKKKTKKKVVIQSPPRSPEEPARRISLGRPPSPPLPAEIVALKSKDNEDLYSSPTTDPAIEQAFRNMRKNSGGADLLQHPTLPVTQATAQAPSNPFARTLASSEQQYNLNRDHDAEAHEAQAQASSGKPAFDVDMFKDILLNGVSPPARPALSTSSAPPTTSFDRQRASNEEQELDGDHSFKTRFPAIDGPSATADAVSQAESTSSSDDDDDPSPAAIDDAKLGTSQSLDHTYGTSILGSSDPDRPLQASPSSSTDIDISSLGRTGTEGSRTAPDANKAISSLPPPPPVSRRQGATKDSQSSHHRSSSVISRSSVQSENSFSTPTSEAITGQAPPPPPSRRANQSRSIVSPASASISENSTPIQAQEKHPMSPPPAPAPRRTPSKAVPPTINRTSSTASRSSLQAQTEHSTPVTSSAPRPPPPRRKAESNRNSVDSPSAVAARSSGHNSRRESNEPTERTEITRQDILSDLAALQREVDELRAKAGS